MEKNGENSIVISVDPKPTTDHETVKIPRNRSLEKRNGSKNIFKMALVMMRGRNRKSKVLPENDDDDDESRSVWKKLVGSMRPLHLQSGSPRHNGGQTPKKMNTTAPSESGDDGFDSASEYAYSPSATSSRYASAVGLNEMVQDEENQKDEEIIVKEDNGNGDGDDMIDAKADEFIAQFYQQMRLQRMDTMDRRYREISLRSLGL
ncbi:uncharacterized protein LOC133285238 [Gastrolobium bilobum]|uniref:uncharacterized protein LOC133285238 n=1 Tax=Gastrolobium bilobum TaxID=150636 RepID=UPI002AB0089C|nr:uncharacterized protein LOC133285238 [Gastrolobium bilobum]